MTLAAMGDALTKAAGTQPIQAFLQSILRQ